MIFAYPGAKAGGQVRYLEIKRLKP
jgi:hypothetical protein